MSSTKHKRPTAACGDCGIDTLPVRPRLLHGPRPFMAMAWPTAAAKIVEHLGEILAYAPDAGGQYDFGFEKCVEPPHEFLCICRLELRLGRPLTAADFTDAPVNDAQVARALRRA